MSLLELPMSDVCIEWIIDVIMYLLKDLHDIDSKSRNNLRNPVWNERNQIDFDSIGSLHPRKSGVADYS